MHAGKVPQAQGKPPPPGSRRLAAVKCIYRTNGNMKEAIALLRATLGSQCPPEPGAFITRWQKALEEQGHLQDAPRSGQPRKLSDEDAERAAEILSAGYRQKGSDKVLRFTSVAAASSKSPELAAIQRGAGASNKTMMRDMKRVKPSLKPTRKRRKAAKG